MRIPFRIGLTTLLVLSLAGIPAAASSYEQATEAMRSGDYARAAELLEETIEASPPWAAGQVALAQCLLMLGQAEPAETALATALEIDPAAPVFDAYAFAGLKLYGEQRYDEATGPLEQALKRAPDNRAKGLSTRLANALFQTGKFAAARDHLQRHQERFGFDAGMAYFLALSYRETNQPGAAIETLEKAVAGGLGDEREARAVERLARWSREHAPTATALAHARRWRDRTPGNEEAFKFWFEFARSSGNLPEYDDAMARLGSIGSEHDTSKSVLVAIDQLDSVRKSLETAVRKEPSLKPRVAKLADSLDETEAALNEALKSLLEQERGVAAALERKLLERCKIVHWNLKTDRAAVSDADRSFYDTNDCKGRVLDDSNG